MIYAQFWHKGTDGLLRPACGSDAVTILDGRYSISRQHETARWVGHSRIKPYDGYTIHSGESFTRSRCEMSMPGRIVPGQPPFESWDISPDFLNARRNCVANA